MITDKTIQIRQMNFLKKQIIYFIIILKKIIIINYVMDDVLFLIRP